MLKQSTNAGPRDDWVERIKCRMIYTAEPDARARVDSSMIKKATGTDDHSDRGLYVGEGGRDLGEPQFTPFMTANRLPDFSGFDAATKRRIRLIPFGESIPLDKQNTENMRALYRGEASGILRLLVDYLACRLAHDSAHGCRQPGAGRPPRPSGAQRG